MELSLVNKLSVRVCACVHFKCSKCTKFRFWVFDFVLFLTWLTPEMFCAALLD